MIFCLTLNPSPGDGEGFCPTEPVMVISAGKSPLLGNRVQYPDCCQKTVDDPRQTGYRYGFGDTRQEA